MQPNGSITFSGTLSLAAAAVVFDIDWAPDWAIALCHDLCRNAGIPATFFVTHDSDILDDLRTDRDRIELGIHPNLLSGSSHGDTPRAILDHCLRIVPEAVSLRTHGLFQSSPLFALIGDHYGIETDASLLLPFHRHLQPTDLYLGKSLRRLVRLPCMWEDDVAAMWPGWDWTSDITDAPGLNIYCFHPIHVALNMESMDRYAQIREWLGNRPLASLKQWECACFIHHGAGTRTYLERLLNSSASGTFQTVSGIALRHREPSTWNLFQ